VNPQGRSKVVNFAYYCAAQLPWLKPDAEKPATARVKSFDFTGKMPQGQVFYPLQQKPSPTILLQRGIAGSPREAAALPGRFLPELGRFLTEAAFFYLARVFSFLALSRLLTC
jgi:hypothetical protein